VAVYHLEFVKMLLFVIRALFTPSLRYVKKFEGNGSMLFRVMAKYRQKPIFNMAPVRHYEMF